MSKELPYFKFYVNEWITGDITFEDMRVQGLFVNICAYYWSKEGAITLSQAKKKFRSVKPSDFSALIDAKAIKIDGDGKIVVSFLDEQFADRKGLSETNSTNGKKGGRPRKEKAVGFENQTENKPDDIPKKSNIEEKREEEKKEEKSESRTQFSAPSHSDVLSFFSHTKSHITWDWKKCQLEAAKFMAHYNANGWKVGRAEMKDWRGAAENWMIRDSEFSPAKPLEYDPYKPKPVIDHKNLKWPPRH